jgi:hypothetical protein
LFYTKIYAMNKDYAEAGKNVEGNEQTIQWPT